MPNASPRRNAGVSSRGIWKFSPSSPPVRPESWLTSTANAEATASVIMAKKIARTRSEKSPITSASTVAATAPASVPVSSAPQPRPICVEASATP